MPISFRSSRKPLVERPLSRISESLCWTKGWLTRFTALVVIRSLYPEGRAGLRASSVPPLWPFGKFDDRVFVHREYPGARVPASLHLRLSIKQIQSQAIAKSSSVAGRAFAMSRV